MRVDENGADKKVYEALYAFVDLFRDAYYMYGPEGSDLLPREALIETFDYLLQSEVFNVAFLGKENPVTGNTPWIGTTDTFAVKRQGVSA